MITIKKIEVSVELYSPLSEAIKKLDKLEFIDEYEIIDIYFYDPLRTNLKPNEKQEVNEAFRLRCKNGINAIEYMVDNFSDTREFLYNTYYEVKIDDIFMINKILKGLGFVELVSIHNSKRTYKYRDYEVSLEIVKELGYFIEVGYKSNEEIDSFKIKKEMKDIIKRLGLKVSGELKYSKLEMVIKKNNIIK